MGDIPRSVELRLGRVEHHMKAFEEARDLFMKSEPFAARRVIEGNGCDHVFVWERYTTTPNDFGLIAGDAIHNLRSSLDHLAVALANAGADLKGVTVTPDELTNIQFPVVRRCCRFR